MDAGDQDSDTKEFHTFSLGASDAALGLVREELQKASGRIDACLTDLRPESSASSILRELKTGFEKTSEAIEILKQWIKEQLLRLTGSSDPKNIVLKDIPADSLAVIETERKANEAYTRVFKKLYQMLVLLLDRAIDQVESRQERVNELFRYLERIVDENRGTGARAEDNPLRLLPNPGSGAPIEVIAGLRSSMEEQISQLESSFQPGETLPERQGEVVNRVRTVLTAMCDYLTALEDLIPAEDSIMGLEEEIGNLTKILEERIDHGDQQNIAFVGVLRERAKQM